MNNSDPKDFIANYELNSYRYSDFWTGREYEHQSEVTLIQRLLEKYLPDLSKREMVDLGGAYGRLAFLYAPIAKKVVLADYSTNELLEGKGNFIQSPYKDKLAFVALNAYRMPFASDSLDALLSVRVMHHLKDIPIFWKELQRTLAPGGVAVIEFANKNHLLAIFRHILRFDIVSYLKQNILHVAHKSTSQGMKEGQVSLMYNFSPSYIKALSVEQGFIVEGMFACSFFRSGIFKKYFSLEKLLKMERYLQKVLPSFLITPSVFIVLRKKGTFVEKDTPLMERLVCPTCQKPLVSEKDVLQCAQSHSFKQLKLDIVDLRDPRPEDVDF